MKQILLDPQTREVYDQVRERLINNNGDGELFETLIEMAYSMGKMDGLKESIKILNQ